jgi:trk system potassium uptake protein TrkA
MRIIIAGAGEVGVHLARMMTKEAQDIVIIDRDKERLQYIEGHIDVITIKGDASSLKVMDDANVDKADLLIAATGSETSNFTIAVLGKKFGAKKTIARITNTNILKYNDRVDIKSLGIDAYISTEDLASQEIERLIEHSAFTDSFEFEGGKLRLLGINLGESSKIINKSIMETASLNPKLSFMPVAIQREGDTLIPRGSTMLLKGDHVYFVAQESGGDEVVALTGKQHINIKNIMILGGGNIGIKTSIALEGRYNIKLIEQDKEKCFELADLLPKAMIINGDGRNVELLEEESIDNMDAFIAVTGNSETNIMSCLVAKTHGVKKTIALVENMDYIHLSQQIGIDTLINKKLLAVSEIFKFLRKGKVISIANLHGVDAEILEFEVNFGSKITQKPIRDLDFPKEAIIGGVVRDGNGYMTMGDFQFQPHDRVVVFALPEAINTVESFFK